LDICIINSKNKNYFSIKNFFKQKFLGTFSASVPFPNTYSKKNPIENGTGIPQNSDLNSGYSFMLSGLISCAVYVVLIRYWAGAFHGKTKVPCICTLNDFIFQMALGNRSETLLLKCIIQISGQDHWNFCALMGECTATRLMRGCRASSQRALTA